MCCPDGFVLFSQLYEYCNKLAAEYWRAQLITENRIREGMTIEKGREIYHEKDFLALWMLTRALDVFPTYLCSSVGDIVLAGKVMLLHEDNLELYDWTWPIAENGELGGPFLKSVCGCPV